MADDEGKGKPRTPGLDPAVFNIPKITLPDVFTHREFRMPEIPVVTHPAERVAEANYASEFHKRLVDWIRRFDDTLDQNHEVGVRLVSFGQSVTFHLEDLGFWNPSLISFKGHTEEGAPVELIQHVSQISVLLVRLPREDPNRPKRPIGFGSEQDALPEE